jgi:hypothetical protein
MLISWRIPLIAALAGALLFSSAAPAAAWSNGTNGCNSYGTHDWVLDQAITAAGDKGSWIHKRAALRATDDPDCKDGIDHASGSWWHVWDEWGDTYGGAPEAARVWFKRTQRRLAAGNERAASKALGIFSHFVADVANPMHTDGWSSKEERVHPLYEAAVDRRCTRSDCIYSFSYNGPDAATPGRRTKRVARAAHPYYGRLIRAYDAHSYNSQVHRITKRQLNRAANAVADLITSVG